MKKLHIIGVVVLLLAVHGCNICGNFHGKNKLVQKPSHIVVCDSAQFQSLNDSINVLRNKIAELENKSTENMGLLSIDNKDFYESVVKSYDSIQSGYYKQLVGLLSAIQDYNKDVAESGNEYIEIDKDTVQMLRDSIAGLQNRIEDLENISEAAKAVQNINDKVFFREIIKAPLTEKYDSVLIGYYKQLVELFDYKGKSELNTTYNIYYPLLENYGKWNDEIAGFISRVVKTFERRFPNNPSIESEKENIKKSLESCEYYKEYRYKYNGNLVSGRYIEYLDNVIKDTDALFDDPSKFKKENFEEQLKKLK